MYGFTIHINLQSKTISNYSLKNQDNLIFKNFSFNYLKFEKFENDKIFKENNDYIIGIDGVVLNLQQLKNQYAISDYFKLIIQLFNKENIGFISKLKGEFSGFIFNKKTEVLCVFNNKTATKQVFYSKFNDFIIISPTIKNIIHFKRELGLNSLLNQNATYNLLTFGGMLENNTLVKSIYKLGAGEYLKIDKELKLYSYSSFNNIDYSINNKNKAIDGLNELFISALKLEYNKDLEYKYNHLATLSGGLDSRMTVMISNKLGYKNDTFCFSQSGYLDEMIATEISKKLELEYRFIPLNTGEHLTNLTNMVAVNNGLQFFTGSAHFDFSVNKLNLSSFGLIHTGQIGDGILGGFVTKEKEIFSKLISDKLLNKINIDKSNIDKYKNEEVYKLYQRAFNLTNFGSFVIESHQTYLTSPFLDSDFIEFALSINPKLKYNQNIYLQWIAKYHPEIADYKWERTGFKPNKIWKTKFSRYTKKLIKEYYNLTNQSEKFTMTPSNYWFKNNIQIKQFYNSFFENNIGLVENDTNLKKDLIFLFKQGNTTEKAMVLTVLEIVKKFKLHV